MIDSKLRTIAKSATWRLTASILLGTIAFAVTGNLAAVTLITIIYTLLQIVVYFLHDRFWNYIKWGKTKGLFIQMTGLSGSGKSTLSISVADKLRQQGYKVEVIDGDEYRESLCSDLSFSKEDRNTNIRRLGFVGKVLARNNVIAIMAAINPYEKVRKELENQGDFVRTVYIKCDIDVLKKRDPKGLYKRALLDKGHPQRIENFTGISDPFEEPVSPDIVINTDKQSLDESTKHLYNFIINNVEK